VIAKLVQAERYPIARACRLLELRRSSYYYTPVQPDERELEVALEAVLEAFPTYGSRRVSQQLRRAPHQMLVNRKRARRVMRQKGWLQPVKRRKVRTTNSQHPYPRYPNLVKALDIVQPDQVWVADITYIRLQQEFIFLAVVLDVFTRSVRGWALSRQIDQQLSLAALQMGLQARRPHIHHSDQGVQYAALAYVELLKAHQIQISMAAVGKAEENGYAERFMRTIKEEEVDLSEYRDFGEALRQIGHFIEEVYNHKRIHSALGYRTPVEFERAWGLARTLPAREAPLSRA
jgi:transposase InsO family protein